MTSAGPGLFRRLTRRLTEDIDERDAVEIADASLATGAIPAVKCCRGEEVTMFGRLRSVGTCPKDGNPVTEAELYDGTDTVQLIWIGRRRIPGIETGKTLLVRGRVGEREGRKVMYNPYYELREKD